MPENFEFLLYRSAEEDVSVNAVIKDEFDLADAEGDGRVI